MAKIATVKQHLTEGAYVEFRARRFMLACWRWDISLVFGDESRTRLALNVDRKTARRYADPEYRKRVMYLRLYGGDKA